MNNTTFQYAILRYYHDPVTQEFLNIGVVVYSRESRFLQALLNKRYGRVSRAFDGIDRSHYGRMINSIDNQISRIGFELTKPSLFDGIPDTLEELLSGVLPNDDSSLRFGGFGGGLAADLEKELSHLSHRLVEKYEGRTANESRRDDEVWHDYAKLFADYRIVALATVDASSGGNILTYDNSLTDQAIDDGDTVSFAAGSLDILCT